jgi:transketolase
MAAGHRKLDNLTLVIDRNRLQQGARTEDTNGLDPLDDKWRAFGWDVVMIDGHDHEALYDAFTGPRVGKPRCIIANTTKGKGVSFIEDRVEWHHKVPSPEQIELALKELV